MTITHDVLVMKKMDIINHLGKKLGVTAVELAEYGINKKKGVPFYRPKSKLERFEQLFEVYMLMMVSSPRNSEEIKLIKDLTTRFGFSLSLLDDLNKGINDKTMELLIEHPEIHTLMNIHVENVKKDHNINNNYSDL
jgi:hypothetical protein